MYGMNKRVAQVAEDLLKDFTLDEILEMNELLPEDLIEMLLEAGLINDELYRYPETEEQT